MNTAHCAPSALTASSTIRWTSLLVLSSSAKFAFAQYSGAESKPTVPGGSSPSCIDAARSLCPIAWTTLVEEPIASLSTWAFEGRREPRLLQLIDVVWHLSACKLLAGLLQGLREVQDLQQQHCGHEHARLKQPTHCSPRGETQIDSMEPMVLVVDDDDTVREITALILEEAGYRVLVARDGNEALEQVRDARPDGVLLDMMMPEVDGLQFLHRLPRECSGRLPVVIAYSGFERLEDLARAHGAAAFLKKPVDPRHLLEALATMLGNRQPSADATAVREKSYQSAMAEADRHREDAIHSAHLATPAFRMQLRWLVSWLAGYFAAEVAIVGLVHCGRILVLAQAGIDDLDEDASLDLDSSYCPDVTRAAAPWIVRETDAGALFSGHPAASSKLRFYAGAPLIADGISVGTLCLRGSRPFVVHAEDMAVLGHFAQLIGGSIIRDHALQPPDFFRSAGFLSPSCLPILIESARLRAERDRSALALAIAEASDVERFGRVLSKRPGPRYLALASLEPGVAAILAEGGIACRGQRKDRRSVERDGRVHCRPRFGHTSSAQPRALS